MTLLILLYLVFYACYLRGSLLAIGVSKKLYKTENFLVYQKIALPFIILALLLSIVGKLWISVYLTSVDLIFLSLFYLQPTPRTTKSLLKFLGLAHVILLIIYFLQ